MPETFLHARILDIEIPPEALTAPDVYLQDTAGDIVRVPAECENIITFLRSCEYRDVPPPQSEETHP